jgi:hypothetical protein
MHPHAQHAIRAAQNVHSWGLHACQRYCERRGVPLRLFHIALRLEGTSL